MSNNTDKAPLWIVVLGVLMGVAVLALAAAWFLLSGGVGVDHSPY